MLRRLEDKGARAAAKAVKRIADWFCEGSVEEVVAGLVDARMLDNAELARLTEKIAQSRRRSGK